MSSTRKFVITAELIPEEGGSLRNLGEAAELHIEEIGLENLKIKKVQRKELEMVLNV